MKLSFENYDELDWYNVAKYVFFYIISILIKTINSSCEISILIIAKSF